MLTTATSFAGRIEPPLPPRNHVARPRLREALDAAVPHGVTLVVAPAGFGKTVALADFARTAEFPVAWLSMVSADADVVTFADTLVRAVQRIMPGFGERVLQIVRRAGGRAVEVLAVELADELAGRGGPIGLVLDDFHAVDPHAKETADAVRLVDLLLERAPSNLFVLIGSRTLPALRHADIASAGRLHGVAAEELRFTPAEVAEWLGVEPSDRRAAEAYDRTGGWAAALLLGGLALPGDALAGYLKREIWDGLEPEAQRFFLRAAVPSTLTADLCRDVLGEPKGPLYLEDARQSSLFVAALPSGQWRLHDLFRDFLRDHLRATDHAEWVRSHRRVARDLLAAGAHAEAITLLIDAGLDVEAADALAEHAEQIAAEGRWVAVRRWIAELPPRTVRARHKLLLLQARAHMQGGEASQTLPLLDRAVEACAAAGDQPAAAAALAARAGRLAVSGRFDEAMTDCRRARDMLAGQEHPALATAGRVEGLVAASQGDQERALGALAAALGVAQRCRDRAEVATCERSIGWVYSNNGQPGAAAAYYARAARIWDELDDLDQALEIRVSLGHVYLEQGADDLARGTFEQARVGAERIGHQRMLSYALSNLGSLDRDAGSIEAAAQRFEAALEIARQKDDYQLIVLCVDHLAQCRLLLGDAGGAEALARQSLAEANRLDSPQLRGRAWTTLAWALLARQDVLAAAKVATAAVDQQGRTGTNRDRIRALLARALSRYLVREPGWLEDLRASATTLSATPARAFLAGLCRIADPHLRAMRAEPTIRHAVDALLSAGAAPPVSAAAEPSPCDGRETLSVVNAKLLGRPGVTVDGAQPRDPDRSWGRLATRELFYLLEAHRAGLTGDTLIEHLWPDQPPGRGQSLLWNHVTRLRAVLGATNRREGRSIVMQADGLYKLHPDLRLVTDVAAFEAAVVRADAAQPGSDEELAALAAADAAYTGEYLEGVDAIWAIARRAALARGYARVLHRSAQRRLTTDPPEAVAYAERLLAEDPTSERACELVLRCLKAAGDQDRARQIYRAFASRVRDDFGVEPAPGLAALVAT